MSVFTGDVASQCDVLAESLGKSLSHRSQGVLRVDLTLRAAKVCGQDNLGAALDECLDGRQRSGDASGVGDVTLIVQWDVEVGADEYVAGLNAFGDEII